MLVSPRVAAKWRAVLPLESALVTSAPTLIACITRGEGKGNGQRIVEFTVCLLNLRSLNLPLDAALISFFETGGGYIIRYGSFILPTS